MTSPAKRILVVFCAISAVICLLVAGYLQTFGHYFLPMPTPPTYANEKIEEREYSPFAIPAAADTFPTAMKEFGWPLKYPGQARLIAMAEKLKAEHPGEDFTLKDVFERLGYPFPTGCSASTGELVPHWRIANFPTVLNRIERDLKLKPIFTNSPTTGAQAKQVKATP